MSSSKHILFIHHGHGIGGAPISMRTLLDEVIKIPDVKITILFLFKSDAETLFIDFDCEKIVLNKPYYYFNHTSRHPKWYRFELIFLMLISWVYTSFIRAPKLLKKINPDLIYLNSCVLTDWSYAAHKLGIKNILHVREAISNGLFGIRHSILSRMLNKYPDLLFFISKENRSRIKIEEDTNAILAYDDIGLEFDQFDLKDRQFSTDPTEYKVGFLGGISKIKGIGNLVGALPHLNCHIDVLIGGYIDENKYRSKFGSIPENVSVIGLVNEMIPFINSIDLLVVPITTTHFCRPIIEAAALGKPSVLPNLAGMDEMIDDEITGFIFEAGNPIHLAKKINYAEEHREELKKIGDQARIKYEMDFSRKKNIEKIIIAFEAFLK